MSGMSNVTYVTRTVLWRRVSEPGLEYCTLVYGDEGAFFGGHVIASLDGRPYRVEYTVECDPSWATTDAYVHCFPADGTMPALELQRDDENGWRRIDLEHPDISEELPEVRGCVDVDLGITPATNTLPIRRLGLAVGESADVTAAWVRFPELSVRPLRQRYVRLDANRYRYESDTGFSAELTVDDHGLVTLYPGGWEQVAAEDSPGAG
jgi:hypothetical protein